MQVAIDTSLETGINADLLALNCRHAQFRNVFEDYAAVLSQRQKFQVTTVSVGVLSTVSLGRAELLTQCARL